MAYVILVRDRQGVFAHAQVRTEAAARKMVLDLRRQCSGYIWYQRDDKPLPPGVFL